MKIFFNFLFFEHKNIAKAAIQDTGTAIVAKENLNHRFQSITLTIGVHILAHKTTPIALLKSIIPAAINDTTISNTAELHCNINVAKVQTQIDLNNVSVVFFIKFYFCIHNKTRYFGFHINLGKYMIRRRIITLTKAKL